MGSLVPHEPLECVHQELIKMLNSYSFIIIINQQIPVLLRQNDMLDLFQKFFSCLYNLVRLLLLFIGQF